MNKFISIVDSERKRQEHIAIGCLSLLPKNRYLVVREGKYSRKI